MRHWRQKLNYVQQICLKNTKRKWMNVRYKNKEKMSVISVLDNALQTTVKSGLI